MEPVRIGARRDAAPRRMGVRHVCQEHWGMLRAFARKLLRGREADADDFAQDAIRKYLECFGDGKGPSDPAAWLMRTMMNLLLTDWRKRVVRRKAQEDPNLKLVAGPQAADPDPEDGPISAFEGVSYEALEMAV